MGVPAGPWYIDDTLTFTVNTHDVATGAGTDADAVPSYRIYEDETGTAILNGNTAKLDDANTVGFYSEQITLSAANGFEVGKSYSIYVAATVDSIAATQSYNFKVITNPQTLLSAIDTKTTNLPSDPADASVIAGRFDTLDTSVADLPTNAELGTALGTADDAVLAAIAALNDLSAADILAAAYEGSETVQDFLRLSRAILYGEVTGGQTGTERFRDLADAKDRVVSTTTSVGNRTAVVLDAT